MKVSVKGSVVYNQIKTGTLGTVKGGHAVTMSFLLDSDNFVNGTTTPTRGYAIDPASFAMAFKTVTVGLQSPFPAGQTPYFVLRDNDPKVDGFFIGTDVGGPTGLPINVLGNAGNLTSHFLATYGGTQLSSLDLLGAVGSYDFTGMTVFGFRLEDGPNVPMEIDFVSMTISIVPPVWTDRANALAGVTGEPRLVGLGDLSVGSSDDIALSNAAPGALGLLFVGLTSINLPFKGGTLVPAPDLVPVLMTVDAGGAIDLPFTMPAGFATGTQLWMQWAIADATAVRGVALSNALEGLTP